jgi:hypothetical protein
MTRTASIGPLSAALLTAMACSSTPSENKGTGGQGDSTGGTPGSFIGTGSGGTAAAPSTDAGTVPSDVTNKPVPIDENGLVKLSDVIGGGLIALVNNACEGRSVEPEPKPVGLQMVIDTSSSMVKVAHNTPASGPNKWSVTRDALKAAVTSLPLDAAVGLTFYPNMATLVNAVTPQDPTFCVNRNDNVPIDRLSAAGSAQRQAISRGLDAINIPDPALGVPGAGTPTYDGYYLGLGPLVNLTTVTLQPDQKFMLLITDGMPTFDQGCLGWGVEPMANYVLYYQNITAQVAAAKAQGIRTFVIGSPGSEASESDPTLDLRPSLSKVATAGGTAPVGCSDTGPNYCHFDMSTQQDFSAGLLKALGTIASTMVACNYTVPAASGGLVIDAAKVTIVYTPDTTTPGSEQYLVAPSTDPNCPAGWRFTNAAQTEIEICGRTCALLMNNPEAKLDLAFACKLPDGVF